MLKDDHNTIECFAEKEPVKFCPNCGQKIKLGMNYCSSCGNDITQNQSEVNDNQIIKDIEYLYNEITNGEKLKKQALLRAIVGGICSIILFAWLGSAFDGFRILGVIGIVGAVISMIMFFSYKVDIEKKKEKLSDLERKVR